MELVTIFMKTTRKLQKYRKKIFFNLKAEKPEDEQIARTKEIMEEFDLRKSKARTMFRCNTDVFRLTDVSSKFVTEFIDFCVATP